MEFKSVAEILDYAIQRERDAADFYTDLAGKMSREVMKTIFLDFAREEKIHQAKLLAVKKGQKLEPVQEQVLDLKIGDYLVDIEPSSEVDYQQALIIAMKSEKVAYRLYTDLARATDDVELREMFLGLAQEEAKHKLSFELEYDEVVLKEN